MRKHKRKRKRKRICGLSKNANEYASAKVYVNAIENTNSYVVTQKKNANAYASAMVFASENAKVYMDTIF